MKKWTKPLIILLIVTNIVTLGLLLVKQKELAETKKLGNFHNISVSGENEDWKLKDALFVVTPSMYMVKGGTLSYSGDKTLKIKQINIEMALKKKDGTIDDVFGSGGNYENVEPEIIKKGYKEELGTTVTTLSLKEYKTWKKDSKHMPMTISILYTTADDKEHKSVIKTTVN